MKIPKLTDAEIVLIPVISQLLIISSQTSRKKSNKGKNEENTVDTTELDQHHVGLQGDEKALNKDRGRKSIRVNAVCII